MKPIHLAALATLSIPAVAHAAEYRGSLQTDIVAAQYLGTPSPCGAPAVLVQVFDSVYAASALGNTETLEPDEYVEVGLTIDLLTITVLDFDSECHPVASAIVTGGVTATENVAGQLPELLSDCTEPETGRKCAPRGLKRTSKTARIAGTYQATDGRTWRVDLTISNGPAAGDSRILSNPMRAAFRANLASIKDKFVFVTENPNPETKVRFDTTAGNQGTVTGTIVGEDGRDLLGTMTPSDVAWVYYTANWRSPSVEVPAFELPF